MNLDYSDIYFIAMDYVKEYYRRFDKERATLSQMYRVSGELIWDGSVLKGIEEIHNFFMDVPPCNHLVRSIKPKLIDVLFEYQKLLFVEVCGVVEYHEKEPHSFKQTFTFDRQIDTHEWLIATDTFIDIYD